MFRLDLRSSSARSTLARVAFLAMLLEMHAVLGCSEYAPSPADASASLAPLWTDEYEPLDTISVPPWPRNISSVDANLLRRAHRVVVATLDPYATQAPDSFHGYDVLGVREYNRREDAVSIANQLIDSTRGINGGTDEFYPEYGMRIHCELEEDDHIIDFLISPEYKAFYVLTQDEQRYCIVDRDCIRALMRELTAGLPQWESSAQGL